MLSPQASLIRLNAEITAVERRREVAEENRAPLETRWRLYLESVCLRRQYGVAVALMAPKRRAGDV